jgi:hypothetical protein
VKVPGYRSCGGHGKVDGWRDRIDLNCGACMVVPKRKTDSEYVHELKRLFGIEDHDGTLSEGEQLEMEVG